MVDEKDFMASTGRFIVVAFVGLIVIGILIGSMSDEEPDDAHIVPVSGTLLGWPDVRIYTNGETRSVILQLREYPNHTFVISGHQLDKTMYKMMSNYLEPGDSVFLKVPAKHLNETGRGMVSVYGASSSTQVYLAE